MKMKAIFAAAVLAVSAMPTISAKAAPSAEMYTWIPTTFEAARDFCLVEHGATYIDGRTVCAVFREYDAENRDYSISVDGNSKPTEIYHETFNTPAGYTGELYKYEVVVYYAENGGQFDISLHSGTKTLDKYSFQSQFTMDSAKIAETDYFSWVPDCYSEYTTFIETNGNTLVKDKYICFCDDVNYSTGADISMEQSGTAEIKEVQQFNVSKSDEAVAGNTAHTVRLYEAVTPGTVDVTIYKGRMWDPNAPKEEMLSGSYEVSESMTITPIEKTDFIKGDVNADGNFTVADVVMLQKWLLAVPDVTLPNWKAADLCEDGTLNVFDLCMMKRELLSNVETKETALLHIHTTYGGHGEDGQDLGSGEFDNTIIVSEGDTLIENHMGHWYIKNDETDSSYEDILEIKSINSDSIVVSGSTFPESYGKKEITLKYNEALDLYSTFTVFDGINFNHTITFDKIDNNTSKKKTMTMNDVFELSKKGKNLTWSDFENYQHGEDIGSGLSVYEFKVENCSDRFTLVVGYSDENSLQYVRLKSSGSTIDITESSENDIMMFIAEHNPPA